MRVNAYSEKWLRRRFPWVYPKELTSRRPRPGDEVVIHGPSGSPLGRGIADDGWLAARVYRFDQGPLDWDWLWGVLDQAALLREHVVGPETTGYRLVHGENDGLPAVRIDWWSHYAVITLDSPAAARFLDGIVAWLEDRRSPRGVFLCYRPDPRDTRDPAVFSPPPSLLAGRAPKADVRVTERGVAMLVRPADGPDVGMYPDMREVRAWLEPHWGGRSVLNTFAYTGAFSVAALVGGAAEVVSVDLSTAYLDRLEANLAANALDPSLHQSVASDTFKTLDRLRRTGRRFDVVVLDPPSFSRSKAGTWSAKKDYPRLVAAACRVLAPGGWLVAATNQGELSPKAYRGLVTDGLRRARRDAQELLWAREAPDHPGGAHFPEGRYLKVGVWRVL